MSDIHYHPDMPAEHDWTTPKPGEFCIDVSQETINEWISDRDKKWFPQDVQEPQRDTQGDLRDKFVAHADKWEHETAYMSATPMRVMHPSYQSIMSMGPDVIPLLLKDLQDTGRHWFWALRHLVGEDPVSPKDRGNVDRMITAWIRWGKAKGKI